MNDDNWWKVSGELTERECLRYTPAGIPVSTGRIHYQGAVEEAGHLRQLDFEISIMAIGTLAEQLQQCEMGTSLEITGFIAPKSKRSRQWILHLQTLDTKDI